MVWCQHGMLRLYDRACEPGTACSPTTYHNSLLLSIPTEPTIDLHPPSFSSPASCNGCPSCLRLQIERAACKCNLLPALVHIHLFIPGIPSWSVKGMERRSLGCFITAATTAQQGSRSRGHDGQPGQGNR